MIYIQLSGDLLTSDVVSKATGLINQQQTSTPTRLLFTGSLCLDLEVGVVVLGAFFFSPALKQKLLSGSLLCVREDVLNDAGLV